MLLRTSVCKQVAPKYIFYLLPQGIVAFCSNPCIEKDQLYSAQMLKALFLMQEGTMIHLCDCVQIILYAYFWHECKYKILLEIVDHIVMYISDLSDVFKRYVA